MRNIKWVNKGRTFGVILAVVYVIALSNSTVQGLIGKAMDHVVEGSTVYCYQNDVTDAWWMTR
ncbi:MAG: hypothetical protein J6Q89_08725 [Clostridia bacterium]|nr:hypothetical protein [Clostridia bacterium]